MVRLCSPSAGTGGSGRQKRPRFWYIFCAHGENGLSIDARSAEITDLLKAWGSGDEAALDQLAEHVYPELRRMARRYMKNEGQGNTLQATAVDPRGLSPPGRRDQCRMAGARAVFCHGGADDAAHPGGRGSRSGFAASAAE